MKSVYRATTAAICAFLTGCAVAQSVSTNGTMLADDLTSVSRVVVDAFANASNSVHELIQNVSPTPDFSTNNQTLVDTIVDVSSEPYLSDFVLKSELTNDVCNIVTNVVDAGYTKWTILRDCVDVTSRIQQPTYIGDENEDIWWVGNSYLPGEDLEEAAEIMASKDVLELTWRTGNQSLEEVYFYIATRARVSSNALGLARLSDIAPSVSNTVTKAYIEDLGIESGVDAQTVTNMTTLAPVYSQTPMFQWTCRIGWDEGDGFTGASWSNDVWSVSFIYYGQAYTMPATVVEGTGAQATKLSFDFDGGTYFATRIRTDIIGYTLGAQTNSVIAATNAIISASITNGLVTASITNGLVTSEITNGLVTASITNGLARLDDVPSTNGFVTESVTNGLIGADYISTNNAAFVAAVTNCPVALTGGIDYGDLGTYGTVGALLAALAAAVAALKKKKMPLYPVGGTGNPVNATIESGVLTISPFSMAAYAPTANAAFSVSMGALPSDMEAGKVRDAVLVIDCTSLTDGQEPTVTWDTHYHPRTDAATDFAIVEAGKRAVFYISEYAAGEFAVGGWQETEGGYSPNAQSGGNS